MDGSLAGNLEKTWKACRQRRLWSHVDKKRHPTGEPMGCAFDSLSCQINKPSCCCAERSMLLQRFLDQRHH